MAKSGYPISRERTRSKLRFVFVSSGIQDINKVIDYDYVGFYNRIGTFNLALGDYNFETDTIDDDANTDNGEVYKVFNTVLNTIPLFFDDFPKHALLVKGSDSGEEFAEKCKVDCKKACKDIHECKRLNRRINLYTSYVNANYDELVNGYTFFGGSENTVELFERDKKYDTVIVMKKN